jgi:hypothetical protein
MLKANISYNCGCGYKTTQYSDAEKHVTETGHMVDVSGKISGEKKKKVLPVYPVVKE